MRMAASLRSMSGLPDPEISRSLTGELSAGWRYRRKRSVSAPGAPARCCKDLRRLNAGWLTVQVSATAIGTKLTTSAEVTATAPPAKADLPGQRGLVSA